MFDGWISVWKIPTTKKLGAGCWVMPGKNIYLGVRSFMILLCNLERFPSPFRACFPICARWIERYPFLSYTCFIVLLHSFPLNTHRHCTHRHRHTHTHLSISKIASCCPQHSLSFISLTRGPMRLLTSVVHVPQYSCFTKTATMSSQIHFIKEQDLFCGPACAGPKWKVEVISCSPVL